MALLENIAENLWEETKIIIEITICVHLYECLLCVRHCGMQPLVVSLNLVVKKNLNVIIYLVKQLDKIEFQDLTMA